MVFRRLKKYDVFQQNEEILNLKPGGVHEVRTKFERVKRAWSVSC